MLGKHSSAELLTGGPRSVGAPKVKSAFAVSTAIHDAKTSTIEIFFFISLSFQSLLLFSGCTLCTALSAAILLPKNRLLGPVDPTVLNGKKRAASLFN
jgi:hypothetical protein